MPWKPSWLAFVPNSPWHHGWLALRPRSMAPPHQPLTSNWYRPRWLVPAPLALVPNYVSTRGRWPPSTRHFYPPTRNTTGLNESCKPTKNTVVVPLPWTAKWSMPRSSAWPNKLLLPIKPLSRPQPNARNRTRATNWPIALCSSSQSGCLNGYQGGCLNGYQSGSQAKHQAGRRGQRCNKGAESAQGGIYQLRCSGSQ